MNIQSRSLPKTYFDCDLCDSLTLPFRSLRWAGRENMFIVETVNTITLTQMIRITVSVGVTEIFSDIIRK